MISKISKPDTMSVLILDDFDAPNTDPAAATDTADGTNEFK